MPVVLSTLTPPTIKAQNPLIATRADMRDGTRGGGYVPPSDALLVHVDFDTIDDWDSETSNPVGTTNNPGNGQPDRIQSVVTGHTMPYPFRDIYQQSEWGVASGWGGRPSAAIRDADIAEFGYNGRKVFVGVRESTGNGSDDDGSWNSDCVTRIWLPQYGIPGQTELYAEFYIKFHEDWTYDTSLGGTIGGGTLGKSKLFRMGSYNGGTPPFQFGDGGEPSTHGPLMFWDWEHTSGGIRNSLAFRGGPYGRNYGMTDARMPNKPRSFISGSRGDLTCNWTSNIVGQRPGGGTAQIIDQVNGGYISTASSYIPLHTQVYGTAWHKVAFYMRIQSAVNVADGVFAQWFNDQRIFYSPGINWCPTGINGTDELPLLDTVMIGGNSNFHTYPDSYRRQEMYSIGPYLDIYGTIPSHAEWEA